MNFGFYFCLVYSLEEMLVMGLRMNEGLAHQVIDKKKKTAGWTQRVELNLWEDRKFLHFKTASELKDRGGEVCGG